MKDLIDDHHIRFAKVLNDGWDYLFLGDPQTLRRFQTDQELPDDLLTEFTTHDAGDRAVEQGAMIPLSGINNLPHTVYFTANDPAQLLAPGADLQHHQRGYRLQVDGGVVFLFSAPYLRTFNAETIDQLVLAGRQGHRQMVRLRSGWYAVDVLAGRTRQGGELAPTLEFVLRWHATKPPFSAKVNHAYRVRTDRR